MNISRSKNYANLNFLKSFELTFCRRPERQNEQNVVKIVYIAAPQLMVSSLQQRQCVFLDSGQCFVSLLWAASLQCRRFFFKARDRKFAAIAAILTWEKWVGRGWGKMDFKPNSHSLGRIFVSPQASSEFESKMALTWSNALARDLAKIRLHCRLWAADGSYVHSYFDLSTTTTSPQRHSKLHPHDTAFRWLSLYLCAVYKLNNKNAASSKKQQVSYYIPISPQRRALCHGHFPVPSRWSGEVLNVIIIMHISILSPKGGPRAYVRDLNFQKNFWSKFPPWGPI